MHKFLNEEDEQKNTPEQPEEGEVKDENNEDEKPSEGETQEKKEDAKEEFHGTPSPNLNSLSPQFKNRKIWIATGIGILVVAFLLASFLNPFQNSDVDQLETSQFVQAVEQGRVKSVEYTASGYTVSGEYYPTTNPGSELLISANKVAEALNSSIEQKSSDGKIPTVKGLETTTIDSGKSNEPKKYSSVYVGSDSLGELMKEHPEISYTIALPSGLISLLSTFAPILLIGVIMFAFLKEVTKQQQNQMGFGNSRAKKHTEERPKVSFDDVAGVDEAVEEMKEIKDFLADPKKYQKIGAKIPRGCLLVGPPGTGKTLLAKAVAGEAKVPFFSISGSDFVEMFVGVGASRVRDLFKQAREASPSIIFIDEIDAVGRQRGAGLGGGHDEREQTLNQILVEMDGFDEKDSVVLIAATNRSDVLDPALLRPGRFDRQIVVDTPDVKGRRAILDVHSKEKPLGSDVDLDSIAKITPGFTGADLMNLLNESALLTARRNKKIITQREVSESLERVIAGPERKGRVMTDKTKKTIAYHESGHALVGYSLEAADPVHKISIISRGRALGYTLSIPEEDKVLNSLSEMKAELAVLMGGRVAEEIFIGDVTTGASNDLERASKIARAIVTQYGMSPLGNQVFGKPNHEVFLGRDYGNTQDYSEETARKIDDEVTKLMTEAHDCAYQILSAHKQQMDLMASVLLDRETVEGEACDALLENNWDDYLVREKDIIAKREAEEEAARKKDEEEHPELLQDEEDEEKKKHHFLHDPYFDKYGARLDKEKKEEKAKKGK